MIDGHEVRPGAWSDVLDLYDDGKYSAIWGKYTNPDKKHGTQCRLGVRWNGETDSDNGYPVRGEYPVWYTEYEPFEYVLIAEMLRRVKTHPEWGSVENLQRALAECEGGEG